MRRPLPLVIRRVGYLLPLVIACGSDDTVAPKPPIPTQIQIATGNNQEGWAGETLAAPLAVRIADADGDPVAGVAVTFTLTVSGSTIDSSHVTTGHDGIARTTANLSGTVGTQHFVATAAEVGEAPFTASARGLPVDTRPRLISARLSGTCELRSGTPFCWGTQNSGQGGSGLPRTSGVANLVAGNLTLSSISSGTTHVCGITGAGATWCWGRNNDGQVGVPGAPDQLVPIPVAGAPRFVQVEAGTEHTCGLAPAGEAYCWGENYHGALGDGSTVDNRAVPGLVGGDHTFAKLAGGDQFSCGLTTGARAWCWGLNEDGQLGTDTTVALSRLPVAVHGDHRFADISLGFEHACGVDLQGALYCWGRLGGVVTPNPTLISSGPYIAVASGGYHYCVLTMQHTALCAGQNESGQLGNGAQGDNPQLSAVSGGLVFSELTGSRFTTCGRTETGSYCWGRNGLVGDGANVIRWTPVSVRGPVNRIEITAGDGQVAPPGASVTVDPSVRILDADGSPLESVWVRFDADQGGTVTGILGTGASTFARTDALGVAKVRWTLGGTGGTQHLVATVMALSVATNPVTFVATAQ